MKTAILILCLALNLVAPHARADGKLADEVRADYANADYRAAIQKTNSLFSTAGQTLSQSEQYDLWMLRGECQLQVKDRLGAVTAFKSAAKCAGDLNQLAAAKANALVIDRSSMGRFTPRYSADRTPIDILPMESRKQAMAALQAELWSQNKSVIEAALNAKTLPAIEKAFVPLSNQFFLETTAKGEATETGKLMRDLGQQTYRLMQTEATTYARQIEQLNQAANSSSNGDGNWGGTRRGLISTERNALKDAAAYLVKLRDRATEYRGLAGKLGGDEQRWDALVLDINDSLAAAEGLFNDR